jgi:hypothetical protein
MWCQSFKEISFPVCDGNHCYVQPFTGGWKCPQFSETDFNNDGIKDIYVFDRVGSIHGAYIGYKNATAVEKIEYFFSPDYVRHFPEAEGWVLLRDYDKDGITDFFAYSDVPGVDGIQVWKGFYDTQKKLSFKRINFKAPYNIIFFPLFVGGQSNLYVTRVDIPALDDIDCDGDLDIITFNINGGFAEWYRNESVEKNFKADSLLFRLEDPCWGGFYESGFSSKIDLSPTAGVCFKISPGELAGNLRHSGSTLLTLDLDNDGDKELFLGDISFPNITMLTNGGNCKTAWMNKQDNYFPSYDYPVDLPVFPAAFSIDVNQDSLKDLIVAPNAIFNAADKNAILYYKNIGNSSKALFKLEEKNFLVNNTLDVGKGANPAWVDINADGLLDLVIGNYGEFIETGNVPSGLLYFENNGLVHSPSFILKDKDFLNLNRFNEISRDFSPAFADIDGDGDQDIIIGDEMGKLYYGENIAGKGKPFRMNQFVYPFMDIDVGLYATPFVYDLNKDGLSDLLIGERNGNINFFQNIGTASKPFFNANPDLLPNISRWGEVNTNKPGYFTGSSAPVVFQTNQGNLLLTGSEEKGLRLYKVTDDSNPFPIIESPLYLLKHGSQVKPAIADINNDGFYELLVGNARGGLQLYSTPWQSMTTANAELTDIENNTLLIYPNPADEYIRLLQESNDFWLDAYVTIYDMLGRKVIQRANYRSGENISLVNLPRGIYYIQLSSQSKVYKAKMIK